MSGQAERGTRKCSQAAFPSSNLQKERMLARIQTSQAGSISLKQVATYGCASSLGMYFYFHSLTVPIFVRVHRLRPCRDGLDMDAASQPPLRRHRQFAHFFFSIHRLSAGMRHIYPTKSRLSCACVPTYGYWMGSKWYACCVVCASTRSIY
ncbi:hypothetical protein LZ30DRAFT_698750 [Colletotrichum cereale]|nr:hypothetical protein LZ30DRAFT_698750 [Colletotrichum cereale]